MPKYYTTDKILSKEAEYYISIGGRNNGKSTAWGIRLIDEYFDNGGMFGKIERTGFVGNDDIYLAWFTEYAQNYCVEKYNHYITVIGHKFYLVDKNDEYLELEKNQRTPRLNLKPFGRVFSLLREVKYKSTEYPNITTLIFEEFTLLNQYGYLENEIEHFLSLLSTINRNRTNLKVVLIGNTISKFNPYFDMLGININKIKLKQGDIVDLKDNRYKYGARIRIEFAESIYESEKEVPRVLQIGGNDIAITGDFLSTQYVVDKNYDDFILKECSPIIECSISYNNKIYYIMNCCYKTTTFIFITNRGKQYKCNEKYSLDKTVIECIKYGFLTRNDLYKKLLELDYKNIIYSDEDIEYQINSLLINRK